MPGLVKRTVRTTQPQTAYLDSSNYFTKDLKGVWVPTSNRNIVTGVAVTMGTDVTISSSEGDPCWLFTGTTNSYISTNTLSSALGLSGTSSKTILAVINQKSTSTNNKHVFGMGIGGSNGADFLLRVNIVGDTYGQLWGADIISGNGNSYLGRTSKAIIALSFESSTQTVTLRGGSAKVSGTYALNTSNSNIDIGRWVYNNANYVGKVYGCFAWNRALSDAEYNAFYSNPWQIFQPDVSYLDAIYQERLTITPDESRWMGSRGRSTEVSEVIQKHTSVRTSQPQGPVEIDWGNSITKGLVSAIIPGTSNSDIVNKKPFNATNPKKVYSSGVAVNTSNYGQKTNSFPKLSIDATILWIGVIDVQASTGQLLTNRWAYHGTGIPIGLCSYTSPARAGFNVLGISNALIFPITTLPGNLVSFIGKRSNTLGSLFENGVLLGTGTFNTTPIVNDDIFPLTFGSLSNDTNGEKLNGSHILGCVWNRALSDAEIKSISANPWQLFKPHQKTLVYEHQVPKIDPPKPKVRAAKLVKHVRTQQPQRPVGVDWSNPIIRGMHWLYDATNNRVIRSDGSETINSSNVLYEATKAGVVLKNTSSTSSIQVGRPPNPDNVTFIALINRNRTSYSDTGGSKIGNYEAHNYLNAYPAGFVCGGYASGLRLNFEIRPSGGGEMSLSDLTTANNSFELQAVVGRYGKGTVFDLQVNDVQYVGSIPTNGIDAQFFSKLRTSGGAQTQNKGGVFFVAAISRCITDAERDSFIKNPWQIFQPESKTVWVDA